MSSHVGQRRPITVWQVLRFGFCVAVLAWWIAILGQVVVDYRAERVAAQLTQEARQYVESSRATRSELHVFVARRLARRGWQDRRFAIRQDPGTSLPTVVLLSP